MDIQLIEKHIIEWLHDRSIPTSTNEFKGFHESYTLRSGYITSEQEMHKVIKHVLDELEIKLKYEQDFYKDRTITVKVSQDYHLYVYINSYNNKCKK